MTLKALHEWLNAANTPLVWAGNWLDRKFIRSVGEQKTSINPSNNKPLVTVHSSRDAFHLAIQTLSEKFTKDPSAANLQLRIDRLRKLRNGLADSQKLIIAAIQLEAGKPRWEAEEDFRNCLEYLDWIASNGEIIYENALKVAKSAPGADGKFVLRPVGTVCAYLPFSTSLTSFTHYYVACCLAGCPMVVMPSSHTILIGIILASIDEEVDFSDGWLSIVFGSFHTFKTAVSSKHSAALLYTGSREHCEWLRKENRVSGQIQELLLQSGGKNSLIVQESADVELAVQGVFFSAFKSMGQLCSSASRLFVHKSISKDFFNKLSTMVRTADIGQTDDLTANGPLLGPLYSQKAAEKFFRYQTMGRREAKDELTRGQSINSGDSTCLVRPSVMLLKQFDALSSFQQNVLYSPILAAYEFEDIKSAIPFCNNTDAPYAVSVFNQEGLSSEFSKLEAPNLLHNLPTVEIECTLPLAGWNSCGNHRYGAAGIMIHLTRPQLLRSFESGGAVLKRWPKSP